MTDATNLRAASNDAIKEHRTRMVRAEMEKLLACLDPSDLDCLRRAESGLPLVVLGWNQYPDDSGNRSLGAVEKVVQRLEGHQALAAIERLVDKLFGRYEADPPDPYHWPDLREDLSLLQSNIRDLREALDAGQIDNALGRAIAIGTGFARIGYWLLAGRDAAAGAMARIKGGIGARQQKEPEGDPFVQQVKDEAIAEMRRRPRSVRSISIDLSRRHKVSVNTLRGWLKEQPLAATLQAMKKN